ncbi:MAG: DUF3179 domain-containing (seleno)protein [Chloroflexota bacterium]
MLKVLADEFNCLSQWSGAGENDRAELRFNPSENCSTPNQFPPMARVLTIDLNGEAVAYLYEILSEVNVINDTVGGEGVVVFWMEGTASALDAGSIGDGREVGAAVAYSRLLDPSAGSGQMLTFTFADGKILDEQTNSEWNIFGLAIAGELKSRQLKPVVSVNHFWFSCQHSPCPTLGS